MNFIEELSRYAIEHGIKNDVLPSLIIAQGILESASGTSELAVNAHNLFGIKEGNGWSGAIYPKKTAEHKPDGTVYYIIANFRKYPTYEGAVADLVYKYSHGTGWESFNRYQKVLGEKNYKKATEAIHKAGYATDVNYASKLNGVIEKYNLTQYDKEEIKLVKIALDAGHGINTAGKRTPDGEREWSFNNKVLLATVAELNKYESVQILRLDDPTGKTDVPLLTRTNKANTWKADALVSIHHNALAGKWHDGGGVETFVHPTASRASFNIAELIQPRIVTAMGLRNRGVKTNNLHMTRESNMPAILTEGGFMDSTTDIGALRSDAKLNSQGVAIAQGLATYFKLKLKSGVAPTPVAPKPKEESIDKMKDAKYLPTSGTIKNSTATVLQQLENMENGLNSIWREDMLIGELSISDAIGLIYVAIERGLVKGK